FDPHLALQPAAAVMDDGAGAALASLAMTDIDAIRLARSDRPQLPAMTFRDPLHLLLPRSRLAVSPVSSSRRYVSSRLIHLRPRRRVRSQRPPAARPAGPPPGRAPWAQSGSSAGSPPSSRPMSRATAV